MLPNLDGREPDNLPLLRIDESGCRFDEAVCDNLVNAQSRRVIPDEVVPIIEPRSSVAFAESPGFPGRVAEITDPVLALILTVTLELAERLQNLRSNSLAR